MKPFFLRDTKNFGDFSNNWLWPKLIPDLLDESDNIRLVGIGSLLKSDLNYVVGTKVIFGSGSGYGNFPNLDSLKDWIFYFVRGPLTAEKFGLTSEKSIVDGAWLVALLPDFNENCKKEGVCFVPHWKTAERGNWKRVCDVAEIDYVDPMGDYEKVVAKIASSTLVITESLHGAIFADLYRTPWIPVKISKNFLNFKWLDWCQSISVPFNLIQIPPSNFIDCVAEKVNPFTAKFDLRINFLNKIEEFKSDDIKDSPPVYYQFLMKTKKILRSRRERLFREAQKLGKFKKLKKWDERYVDNLSSLLNKVALSRPFLSSEKVRCEKIEKLHNVLIRLRKDYRNGSLWVG